MCCGAKDAFVSRTVYVKRPSKRNIFPYQFISWESQSASGHPLTWQNISRFKARLCAVNVIVLFFRFYTGFRWLFLEICFIKQNFIWDKCELQFCHGTQILVARRVFFFFELWIVWSLFCKPSSFYRQYWYFGIGISLSVHNEES